MMGTFYRQDQGQFHFHDDIMKMEDESPVLDKNGQTIREESHIHSSETVGIAYCRLDDRMHVFTHGTAEGMKKWIEIHNSHSPHKATLKILDQSTSAETLNRAITDPVFFATLLV